jgi:hypothetical protein
MRTPAMITGDGVSGGVCEYGYCTFLPSQHNLRPVVCIELRR